MPNRSKQKGSRAELELVHILKDAGIPARKVPLSGAVKGFESDLLVELRKLHDFPGHHDERKWEVKVRKHGFKQIYGWLEGNYAVACRADRGEWMVTLRLEDMIELMKR